MEIGDHAEIHYYKQNNKSMFIYIYSLKYNIKNQY